MEYFCPGGRRRHDAVKVLIVTVACIHADDRCFSADEKIQLILFAALFIIRHDFCLRPVRRDKRQILSDDFPHALFNAFDIIACEN